MHRTVVGGVVVLIALLGAATGAYAQVPQVIETATKHSTASNTVTDAMTITAGNGYFVAVLGGNPRTIDSVVCDVDGAMTARDHYNSGGAGEGVHFFTRFNSGGGSITCTVDQSGTNIAYDIVMGEFTCPSGGTCSYVASSDGVQNTAQSNSPGHYMAPSGELDLSTTSLWVGFCNGNANLGTRTQTTGFETDLTNLQTFNFWQYEDDVAGFTDERGLWTSSTARDTRCRAYGIANTVSSSDGPPVGSLSQVGQGR